ncbi:hypothetical protein H6P81_010629 [Aristolochia fimbriata]|uniref:Carrier domain-containing protein n=1 Tax=Aristolochia fimbriata TaxID=158543 RepID=A0AAV7EPY8_ARIFI|nr:hypothetical protein H6P81_010629 [Aristolochia fimbriata]
MDVRKSIEDHFSKLHPCLPVETRIGIVGGGPSGLSATYALAKLGYNNITVLEKHHTVGGMCESVDIEGRIYDLGGQVLAANSAPVIFHLAKELGCELEEMDSHKFALIDTSSGKCQDTKVADDYLSLVSLTLKLQDQAIDSGRIGVHAMSEIAAEPTPEFLKLNGFESVPKSVAYGYTASGYGFVQDMPYAYIHEFTRTSMAGKIRRFKGGYTSVWEKLGRSLPLEVLCRTEVLNINRGSDGVTLNIKDADGANRVLEFDKIIITGAFPFRNGRTYRSPVQSEVASETEIMDMNELETELFSTVQTIDYYTTVMKIKGFEHIPMGFYYFNEFMEDPATIGNPVAMQRFYADTDIFLFWSYGNSHDIKGPAVTKFATEVVKNMGGGVEEVILQRRFKYFPHVVSEDMKKGFYEKLETELQGSQNTYYVGGLMAFELTERNSSYAMALVCKHFADDDPLPKFPYVKRLLPLLSEDHRRKQLDEIPGIKFPELDSLDAYLKFWGTHKSTEKKTLYTWLSETGLVANQRSYGELNANASEIARNLLSSRKPVIKPGDRVLLVHVPGLDFVDAFFGCLRAKVLPVPVLPPDPLQRGGQALLKIENVSKACNAVAILSTLSYHSAVRAGLVKNMLLLSNNRRKSSGSWPNLPWLHTDSWVKNSKNNPSGEVLGDESEPEPGDVCFVQFTSGSTGDAKGVMITHGGLIHNVKLMRRRYRSTSNTVLISWLPQYHDMGLIGGLFTALVSGGSAVLFSPIAFIKNPLMWLDTMSKYRATHSAGPNFAFELVVRRLETDAEKVRDFDLSSMIFLMVAAEPVRQKTLKRFVELTLPYGLSQEVMAPGYGLAENCVFVSCAFGEGKPILVDWQGRVCCGYVDSDKSAVDVRIVDPEGGTEVVEHGKEGEIWISSPSAGVGYWGKEEQGQKTFGNVLLNLPEKKFTRTGDLGRIIDGKLFITGRIKDLIIVAGRNIYSADVEKTVENASEILRPGCCAVIGVPEEILSSIGISVPDGSDQLGVVVIAEVRDGKRVDKDVVEQIQTRVAEEHGISVASVKLIKPRTICKTTSGKIRRFECLKQFQEGTLNLVSADSGSAKRSLLRSFTTGACREGRTPRSPLSKATLLPLKGGKSKNEIADFLKRLVSEQTGIAVEKITATETLVSYGIDSIGVVRAAQKLSDFLGVPVGAVDIFTATCIADLASFSEDLLKKSEVPQSMAAASHVLEPEADFVWPMTDVSRFRQLGIGFLQLIALVYTSALLIIPASVSTSVFLRMLGTGSSVMGTIRQLNFLTPVILAPLAWILFMFIACISLSLFGNSFLQPNYALTPEVSIWSIDFVKWWALYKAQDIAGKVLAVHLRGTVFLNYWFQMLGARIGSSVLLDTVDITDPSLVLIGDGAVVAEGALIQSHEVKDGMLSFLPVKIGRHSSVGPYAVIQKGSVLGEESEVPPLQKTESGRPVIRAHKNGKFQRSESGEFAEKRLGEQTTLYHFMGVYIVGLLSALSSALLYFGYINFSKATPSAEHLAFLCIAGSFHWVPAAMVAYATIFPTVPANPGSFAFFFALAYVTHGLIHIILAAVVTRFLSGKPNSQQSHSRTWLRHRITASCHLRFAGLLSGTEAFCVYLRLLGAKIGRHCSIRAINAVTDPRLISIGNGVHLGDFSRLVPGFYSSDGYVSKEIVVAENSVVGSQSVVLAGSVIERDVVLGALSLAPADSVLQSGGVYIGSQSPIMVKNIFHALDERIEEMDPKYKKIVGNLAANLAVTTMKVKSRYFHRIGVSGRGVLKLFDDLGALPDHKMFAAGKTYPVLVRHSNSLSADDDARIDARGAALRILSDDGGDESPLLDLTLKTGKAFYARTIADFATWLVCGLPAREEFVKRAPHVRDAVWSSLRLSDSYAELHYYSNITRLLRCSDGQEMYVKFKLRPADESIGEDSGKVEARGILPPETGAIPRDENDTRPLLFLADDFRKRVDSPSGVRYVFQLQFRRVPGDEGERDRALDCTRPWDEAEFPFIDVGLVTIDKNLGGEESEKLEFNPFLRSPEVDIIRATSCSQSASIDHGRSLVYEICQHIRNGASLHPAWRAFLDQSDVKVDLCGCPMASASASSSASASASTQSRLDAGKVTLERKWYQTVWVTLFQPLLQTLLPYFLLGLAVFGPLKWLVFTTKETGLGVQFLLLPFFWLLSGIFVSLICVVGKWVLVGRKKEGERVMIWSKGVFRDTAWQAVRTVAGEYFMEMTSGSGLFAFWMKLMGSGVVVGWDELGYCYVDSMGAMLNPEMVEMERGGSVGREAVLFGHIYEGDGGVVKFGKVRIGENGFVGSRAVCMPGVTVECGELVLSYEQLLASTKSKFVRCAKLQNKRIRFETVVESWMCNSDDVPPLLPFFPQFSYLSSSLLSPGSSSSPLLFLCFQHYGSSNRLHLLRGHARRSHFRGDFTFPEAIKGRLIGTTVSTICRPPVCPSLSPPQGRFPPAPILSTTTVPPPAHRLDSPLRRLY